MKIARNVEVWIFGAFAGLVVAACLSEPPERSAPAARTAAATEPAPPMQVVYVTAKRLSAADKRASRSPG